MRVNICSKGAMAFIRISIPEFGDAGCFAWSSPLSACEKRIPLSSLNRGSEILVVFPGIGFAGSELVPLPFWVLGAGGAGLCSVFISG